jgi:DNA-binding response OmpR family regulator
MSGFDILKQIRFFSSLTITVITTGRDELDTVKALKVVSR